MFCFNQNSLLHRPLRTIFWEKVLLCLLQVHVFTFYLYFKYIFIEVLLLEWLFLGLLLLKYKINVLVTALPYTHGRKE